jgi:hypothetical protein
MAVQLNSNDILTAALLLNGAGMFQAGAASAAARLGASRAARQSAAQTLRGALSGAEGKEMQQAARQAFPGVTGAAQAEGQALRNQKPQALLTMADIQRIKDQYGAHEYPNRFSPNPLGHVIDVTYKPGPPQENQEVDRPLSKVASQQQTIDYHNNALFKYLKPGMTQAQAHQALMKGFKEEKELPQWWDESETRVGFDFHPSSSAVSAIRITPDARIEVAWGTDPSTYYTFRQFPNTQAASQAVRELVSCGSIGRAVMPKGMSAKASKKHPGRLYGWWNRKNYDAAFAGQK